MQFGERVLFYSHKLLKQIGWYCQDCFAFVIALTKMETLSLSVTMQYYSFY